MDENITIFTIMSALAQEHGAINLAQGFPGYACDPELVEMAYKYMKDGQNQYAPMSGVLPLRIAISDKINKLYKVRYCVDEEICVTTGATEAIHVALQSILDVGDEVIILEPAFDIYAAAVKQAGAKPVFVKLQFPDFNIDWNQVRAAVTDRTKLLIINSPHNPTASIIGSEDIVKLQHLVQDCGIYVLSDEVYEHMVFDGQSHHSVIENEVLREKSFVVFSLGKTFHVTGWRLGYCVGPKSMMQKFKQIHQYVTFSAATPLQLACADHLKREEKYMKLPEFFQKKRDVFLQQMEGAGFNALPCRGTYFQLMTYQGLYKADDVEVAKLLTLEKKVAAIPISVFYHDHEQRQILRFCFAKELDELNSAAARLKN